MGESQQNASAIAYKFRDDDMKSNFKPALAMVAALVGGCSSFETVPPADGDDEYVFACTKAAGRSECQARAESVCPNGFETLSSEENFERKEMRIRCSEVANRAK